MVETKLLQHNDEQVIGQVLAGQTQAFGQLVRRYWKMALAIAYTKCQNSSTAEDIAQDSFLKAYCNLSSLRDHGRFAGWLTRIIHQECASYHRIKQSARHLNYHSIHDFESIFAVKPNPGLSHSQIDLVHNAIGKLPENLQNVIIMRFVGGLPLKHIAEQIEIKYSTVRVWLHRAYKLLKEELAPILEEVQS